MQARQELKAEKNSMALSFVTIHPSLNMTTRLVGPRPQPTTRTPWPLRPDLSSQRWRPHARPVLPLFRLYRTTILFGHTRYAGYTHSVSPSRPQASKQHTKHETTAPPGTRAHQPHMHEPTTRLSYGAWSVDLHPLVKYPRLLQESAVPAGRFLQHLRLASRVR